MTGPVWLDRARTYVGLKEIPGPKSSPVIVRWWEAIKAPFREDLTPWCGAFVGGVLAECGMQVAKNGSAARSWLNHGVPLDRPAVGAIVVFWRGKPSGWSGHVGFVVGRDRAGNLMVLGGNQGDAVNIKPFSTARVLGYRWPGVAPLPARYNLPVLTSDGRVSQNEA
ncbi:TIGR02594 family protein [Mesorhizobium sp. L-2-11]|uniref:TIGR02594 family protein n=1 Tax=Mesorhizobium sp. L-2-11 TaxID=2744521 RepID=UPI0018EA745E|nr:TIGR02594 family protein [Mesorhizobium sp. L-2-11]BCH20164.1 TIGR02594 family protein [Mesorhizobium sp. L-2-11]